MVFRILRYAWPFLPGTLIGLLWVPLALVSGGTFRVVRGCVEVQGGVVTWFLRHGPARIGGASAMTLGHVILGQNDACLEFSRDHEHVHVRQYERWGPAFLPAYGAVSLWLWLRGKNGYFDNPFEREAFGRPVGCPLDASGESSDVTAS